MGVLSRRQMWVKAAAGPLLAALLAGSAVAWRARSIAPGGDESIVMAIPDDAFYYLVLAKHFAVSHTWTFDGVHPATGFHVLWAYLLAAFYAVWPDASLVRVFVFASAVAGFCHAAAAYVVTRRLSQFVPNAAATCAAILVFCAGIVPVIGAFCMESPLLLLAASLSCAAVFREAPVSRAEAAWLLGLGALGSLCRTDYVALPAAFALAQALLVRPRSWRAVVSTRGAICLEGAFIGLALVAAHTYRISGSLVQSSAATKMRWSSMLGHDLRPAVSALGRVLDTALLPRSVLVGLIVASVCAGLALWLARGQRARMQLALAGCLSGVAYLFVYTHNAGATQPWHAGSFAVPVLMLLAVVLASVPRGSGALLVVAIVVAGASQLLRHDQARWPHQRAPMLGGLVLGQDDYPERTGAWNAGVLGYFAGGLIVNLDGLVNDEVVSFARRNELLAYVARENIERIADFGVMIDDPMARKLGGYDSPMADDCISKVGQLDSKYQLRWSGSEFGVYEVDQACLKAALSATSAAASRAR